MISKKIATLFPVILCACAGIGQKKPDITMDGGLPKPQEQVVRLALASSATFPGYPMNTDFGVTINSVNGKPMSGGYLQLNPGKHELRYKCYKKFGLNDTGGAESEAVFNVTLTPQDLGKTYFAWVDGKRRGVSASGGGYYTSYGDCWISELSTTNPWLPRYSR